MHRIDTPTAQADKFGQGKNGFTNGDLATGRRATDLNSDMWDAVQEEICTAIESAGITLDKTKHDQLYQAIVKIITSKIPDALLRNNNLSDVVDKALARANLELGTAAIKNVQQSRDDTTAGRVLVNGGALALRSVAARAGTALDDANNLPANSVSFCYSDAKNSPGYEATILDVGGLGGDGYRVQYAVSYADGGRRIKFRTFNADNGTWAGWQQIVIASGGDYSGSFRFGGVGTLPTESNSARLISAQGGAGNIVSGAQFDWYSNTMTIGLTRGASTDATGFAIWLNNTLLATFNSSGGFNVPGQIGSGGNIVAGSGLFESGGAVRVYSSNNPPPQQDLSPYATTAWVNGNFATSAWTVSNFLQGGIRLVSLGTANNGNNDNEFAYAPNGAVVTAVQQRANYTAVQYRYLQYNVGGNWYTAWVA